MSTEKKAGEVRLPPGFRFHPTDEELVIQYLKRKVFSSPLPASIIPDFDHLSNSDPWDLPGDLEQERYFFCTKEAKYPNGKRWNRATNSGYWKATGLDKQIVCSKGNVIVGMKKTLVFYRGKPPHGSRTDWIMHEYRLLLPSSHLHPNNWVLCRIFSKRRGTNGAIARNAPAPSLKGTLVFYDFLAQKKSDSTSSTTSGITHDHEQEEEEEDSTGSNTFPYFRAKP